MKDKVIRKVYPNLKEIDKSKVYLVGLSGGADSVVLLNTLSSLNFNLVAVHVHHGVRRESDSELEFCRNLAKNLEVPFKHTTLNFSKDEIKNQNSYREKRFEFFKEIYEEVGASGLFLGQHLDDQLENAVTSFFKRKSVLSLKAMDTCSHLNGMTLYRPLLSIRKHEILEMTERHNISYVTDNSNFEEVYERNKVRLKLIPLVEKIFGKGVYKTLEEIVSNAKDQNEINEFYSYKLIKKYWDGESLNLKCLEEHSINILIYSLDKLLKEKGFSADKSSFNDLKNILSKNKSGKVSFKGGSLVVLKQEILIID